MSLNLYSDLVLAFLVYFGILLLIGVVFYRKVKTDTSFVMGDRSLNFWLTALSAHASDMSAWLFMALPAAVFVSGLDQAWIAIGLVVGMWINWQFIAPRLRDATEAYNAYTLSTFFERKFQDDSGWIRTLSAWIAVLFLTVYLSGGLIAMGLLFESLFGIDYYIGLSIAIPIVVFYIFLGGFATVARVDFFQGIFLCVVILIVPLLAYMQLEGGWDQVLTSAKNADVSLHLMPAYGWDSWITYMLLAVGWGVGYYGQPHIVTKFMGIKSSADIYKSKYLGMCWQIITLTAAIAIGLIAIAMFPRGFEDPQLVFVDMVKQLFPTFWIGFVLCAVIAANMSTMDSQILVAASFLSEDVYRKTFSKDASPSELLWVSRIAVIFVAAIAYLLAMSKSSTIQQTVSYAWSGLGSSFGPLILMSLYSKEANRYGAVAGILVGAGVAGVWPYVNTYVTGYDVMPMIPGFFLSLITIWLVSKWTRCLDERRTIEKAPIF